MVQYRTAGGQSSRQREQFFSDDKRGHLLSPLAVPLLLEPRRGELPDEAVAYVARLVGVAASDLGFYEWDGRTVEYHRAQVRKFLGFRECTVADAEKLAAWLAGEVCQSERRAGRVREELLQRCRQVPPPAGVPAITPPPSGRPARTAARRKSR